MEQYIPKSALVAEIEKKIKQYKNERNTIIKDTDNLKELSSRIIMCQEIISFLDTLEVKEVQKDPESIWHDASESPNGKEYVIAWDGKYASIAHYNNVVNCKWCYLSDILPNKEESV